MRGNSPLESVKRTDLQNSKIYEGKKKRSSQFEWKERERSASSPDSRSIVWKHPFMQTCSHSLGPNFFLRRFFTRSLLSLPDLLLWRHKNTQYSHPLLPLTLYTRMYWFRSSSVLFDCFWQTVNLTSHSIIHILGNTARI